MKIALVTGASTGIGQQTAIELSKAGFHTILVARNNKKLEETTKMIEDIGGTSISIPTDLSSIESVNKLIVFVKKSFPQIHLIANIAGVWHGDDEAYAGKDYQTFSQKIILETLNVSISTPMLLVHGLLPNMNSGSKIVNISGTFESGGKGWLPYYVAKRALEDMTVGLSEELKDKNIQVNCISPSDTNTESYAKFFPQYIGDAIEPKEIAKEIVRLSDPKNKDAGKIFVMKKDCQILEKFHA